MVYFIYLLKYKNLYTKMSGVPPLNPEHIDMMSAPRTALHFAIDFAL